MIQEESAILWEMIVCVIVSKKVQMNMGPILDGYGVMGIYLFPYTLSFEPRLTETAGGRRTQLGSLSFALQALCVSHDSRSSQPSGSLFCGRRWHFRKPALSTDQFKLKVISRS